MCQLPFSAATTPCESLAARSESVFARPGEFLMKDSLSQSFMIKLRSHSLTKRTMSAVVFEAKPCRILPPITVSLHELNSCGPQLLSHGILLDKKTKESFSQMAL